MMNFKGVDYYNIDDLLSDDEKLVRDSVREFLEKEVKPLIVDAFQNEKPLNMKELAPKMGELGMIGGPVPEEYGGPETSYMEFGLICHELERVDGALRSFAAVQSALFMYPIWKFGSEEQKHKWLPHIAKGKKIGCFGLTEPNHGSDVAGMDTVAKKDGDEWVIDGSKEWISEASVADVALVFARADEGVRGFFVERGTEGFTQAFQGKKGSMRCGDVGELAFSNCRVPSENILPKTTGSGLRGVFMTLNQARHGISWGAIGAAEDCYETALNYAKKREQFGSPIASYQLVQGKLVKMLTEITKGQLLSYRLSRLMDEKKERHQQISMAKMNNVSVARYCARTAREILGANGVSYDYSPMRHMGNIEAVYTYQGTSDIHTLILGQDITGISAFTREFKTKER
jgi:Acyl-CoA dehydrogenases